MRAKKKADLAILPAANQQMNNVQLPIGHGMNLVSLPVRVSTAPGTFWEKRWSPFENESYPKKFSMAI